MNVAIVAIGDELMNGSTINYNSSWIAKKISKYADLHINNISILYDNCLDIENKIKALLKEKYKYIFVTGGLGPTHDDITKKAFQNIFKCDLVFNEVYYERLINYFNKKGFSIDKDHLKSQAEILECSSPIPNRSGTALGMCIKKNNTSIFIMPGVPSEMKGMMKNEIIPRYLDLEYSEFLKKTTFLTTGITESKLSNLLSSIVKNNSDKYKFSFLPSYLGVKFVVAAKNNSNSIKNYNSFCKIIKDKIGKFSYGFNDDKLEEVVGELLIEKKLSVSFAESCTGGLISKKITDIPGSSNFYKGSIIAYSNEIKKKYLKVSSSLLSSEGAVSQQVALAMADNIRKQFNSDIGLAVTGISGPEGGSEDKPVGLVYIAFVYKNKKIVKKFKLINNRKKHREITACIALNMIRLNIV